MPIDTSELSPQEQITSLYISYYNRAPDPLGLEFWTGQLDEGQSLEDIATTFAGAAETREQFPNITDPDLSAADADAFVTSIYNNLFGRTPDQDGLDFWSDQLTSGSTPVGQILLEFISGARNDADAGTTDETTVRNKIDVGADWAASAAAAGIGTTAETAIAEEVDGEIVVNNQAAFDSAKNILNGVDGTDASVTAAKDTTDTEIADIAAGGTGDDGTGDVPVTGDTFTLTDGGLFEGTSNNDVFIGSPGQIDNAVIDGKEGTDRLNLTVTNGDDDNGIVNSFDLENAFVRVSDGPVTLDFADADGIQQIWNDRSNGDFTIEGATTDTTIGVRRTDADTMVEFEGVSGDSDEATIALDEAETGSQVTINDVETFNVVTFGADESDVTLLGDSVETVNVSGSADADIGAMPNTVTTLDATGFENTLTADVSAAANAQDVTLTSGSGDDVVTAGANFDEDDTFDGGDGDDTFITSIAGIGANDTEFDGVSNFETVRLSNAGTFSATPLAGFDTIEFAGTGNNAALDLDDAAADASVVITDRNIDNTADALGASDISLDDASGSDDTVNLEFSRTDEDNDANTFDAGTVTADGIETINISSSGEDATDDDTTSVTAQVDGDAATAVNISGDNELALTLGDVAGDEVSVDASEATNTVNLSIAAAEAAGVTGGFTGGQADDDSLTITGIAGQTVELSASAFESVGGEFANGATGELDVGNVEDTDEISVALNGGAATDATVSGLSDGYTVGVSGTAGGTLTLDGGGASSALNVALSSADDFTNDLTVNRAGTVTIDASDDADTAQTVGTLTLGTAEDLVISGGDSDVTITTITGGDLESIDSTGLTDGSTLTLGDGAGAQATGNALDLTIGDHGFDVGLEAATLQDTIVFSDDVTDGTVRNFDAGLNGDVLDFSAFDDINSSSDLTLADDGTDLTIDSAAFDGTITLTGVVVGDLDGSSNFDFA